MRSHTSSSIFLLTGRRVGILLFLYFILLLALVTFFLKRSSQDKSPSFSLHPALLHPWCIEYIPVYLYSFFLSVDTNNYCLTASSIHFELILPYHRRISVVHVVFHSLCLTGKRRPFRLGNKANCQAVVAGRRDVFVYTHLPIVGISCLAFSRCLVRPRVRNEDQTLPATQ